MKVIHEYAVSDWGNHIHRLVLESGTYAPQVPKTVGEWVTVEKLCTVHSETEDCTYGAITPAHEGPKLPRFFRIQQVDVQEFEIRRHETVVERMPQPGDTIGIISSVEPTEGSTVKADALIHNTLIPESETGWE